MRASLSLALRTYTSARGYADVYPPSLLPIFFPTRSAMCKWGDYSGYMDVCKCGGECIRGEERVHRETLHDDLILFLMSDVGRGLAS